ncbi:ANTAR domain-containing protein [Terrabacter sp. Ter38]|uniref:ANTAR domain-containing protein n=1 Tax=Terrabacter sp. Ter38 TaxID=2926030 RepID=UPI00211848BD|nr:ANTAR domain-containing protein [Terrabacter sp. Ter38]
MTDLRPATAANDDGDPDAAGRITAAARQLVRSEDLEEALSVAASAIGDVLVGEAVIRVTATHHDLLASASGVVPPSALSPAVREVLAGPVDVDGTAVDPGAGGGTRGLLLESSGIHATCRVWAGVGLIPGPGATERTVAELLLHSLAQAVDRIVTVDRFRENEANLERAVESHRLVGQAMGILIERHRIVSEEAFDVLRRASQDHNVKLRVVAQRVIETGAEPDEVVGRS